MSLSYKQLQNWVFIMIFIIVALTLSLFYVILEFRDIETSCNSYYSQTINSLVKECNIRQVDYVQPFDLNGTIWQKNN